MREKLIICFQLFIYVNAVNYEWFVYIHERGHMVHNSMYNFGSALSYTSTDNNTWLTVHEIHRKEVSYINDPRTPCQSQPREEEMNTLHSTLHRKYHGISITLAKREDNLAKVHRECTISRIHNSLWWNCESWWILYCKEDRLPPIMQKEWVYHERHKSHVLSRWRSRVRQLLLLSRWKVPTKSVLLHLRLHIIYSRCRGACGAIPWP